MVYLLPITPDNKPTDKDRKKTADKKTHLQFLSFFIAYTTLFESTHRYKGIRYA